MGTLPGAQYKFCGADIVMSGYYNLWAHRLRNEKEKPQAGLPQEALRTTTLRFHIHSDNDALCRHRYRVRGSAMIIAPKNM